MERQGMDGEFRRPLVRLLGREPTPRTHLAPGREHISLTTQRGALLLVVGIMTSQGRKGRCTQKKRKKKKEQECRTIGRRGPIGLTSMQQEALSAPGSREKEIEDRIPPERETAGQSSAARGVQESCTSCGQIRSRKGGEGLA